MSYSYKEIYNFTPQELDTILASIKINNASYTIPQKRQIIANYLSLNNGLKNHYDFNKANKAILKANDFPSFLRLMGRDVYNIKQVYNTNMDNLNIFIRNSNIDPNLYNSMAKKYNIVIKILFDNDELDSDELKFFGKEVLNKVFESRYNSYEDFNTYLQNTVSYFVNNYARNYTKYDTVFEIVDYKVLFINGKTILLFGEYHNSIPKSESTGNNLIYPEVPHNILKITDLVTNYLKKYDRISLLLEGNGDPEKQPENSGLNYFKNHASKINNNSVFYVDKRTFPENADLQDLLNYIYFNYIIVNKKFRYDGYMKIMSKLRPYLEKYPSYIDYIRKELIPRILSKYTTSEKEKYLKEINDNNFETPIYYDLYMMHLMCYILDFYTVDLILEKVTRTDEDVIIFFGGSEHSNNLYSLLKLRTECYPVVNVDSRYSDNRFRYKIHGYCQILEKISTYLFAVNKPNTLLEYLLENR